MSRHVDVPGPPGWGQHSVEMKCEPGEFSAEKVEELTAAFGKLILEEMGLRLVGRPDFPAPVAPILRVFEHEGLRFIHAYVAESESESGVYTEEMHVLRADGYTVPREVEVDGRAS